MAYQLPISGRTIFKEGAAAGGARAYVYVAGPTGSPLTAYQDPSLSVPHQFPVVADAYGVMPSIFLTENIQYRLRVEDRGGSVISDDAVLWTDRIGEGEGGGGTVPIEQLHATGEVVTFFDDAPRDGYLLTDGSTFGSAASGASKANGSYQALYLMLWNNSADDDPQLVVVGGRGSTAAADWGANKPMNLPDYSHVGPLYIKI